MMTEEQYKIIDLKETLAIADRDNCKYYQNDNDHFKELCELLNKYIHKINELNWMKEELAKKLNESDKEIGYWKHKVGSCLFILSRYMDKETLSELIEEN